MHENSKQLIKDIRCIKSSSEILSCESDRFCMHIIYNGNNCKRHKRRKVPMNDYRNKKQLGMKMADNRVN